MGIRSIRRRLHKARVNAQKRFHQHKRLNLLAAPGRHKHIMVLDHLKPAYNIGKIFRSADAFGVHEIHLIGIDFFDPAPAMGSFKWVPARFHDGFDTCYRELIQRGYTPFALEPGADRSLPQIRMPEKSAFIFGNEEFGLNFDTQAYPLLRPLRIPQLGRVHCLNVSIAASIVMYEYLKQHDPIFEPNAESYQTSATERT